MRSIAKLQENLPYSSSRSSKVIDLSVNGKPICDLTLAVSATVFEIFTLKDKNCWFYPPNPCLIPARENPLEFLDETSTCKNLRDGGTVWWKFHSPNFNRYSMIHPSDRRTDGRTDRRTIAHRRYSIYAVVRKKVCKRRVRVPTNRTEGSTSRWRWCYCCSVLSMPTPLLLRVSVPSLLWLSVRHVFWTLCFNSQALHKHLPASLTIRLCGRKHCTVTNLLNHLLFFLMYL